MPSKVVFIVISFFLCSLWMFVTNGCAEDSSPIQHASMMSPQNAPPVESPTIKESPRNFKILIRAIGATGTLPDETVMTPSEASQALTVDPRIEDLRAKLSKLPFQSFRLLSSDEEAITLKQRATIHLSNGQKLSVRPLEFNDDRITMWFKWTDDDGMAILDTRLSFAMNDSMVTGIEGKDNDGVILAIHISPDLQE